MSTVHSSKLCPRPSLATATAASSALIALLAVGCTPTDPVQSDGGSSDESSSSGSTSGGSSSADGTSSSSSADGSSSSSSVDGSSGASSDSSSSDGSETTAGVEPPEAAVLELDFSQVKQFDFAWAAVDGAEHYQLLESVLPGDPFVQLGEDVVDESISIAMPLHFRVGASYVLRACNAAGCTDSAPVAVAGSLAEAVGYFKASNTDTDDMFGYSLALSGDGSTLAVGALHESSNATGIDGDQANDSVSGAGAVYVFTRDASDQWSQQAYIKASNPDVNDHFGDSLSLSEDGSTLAVGANYERSSATGIDGNQANDSLVGAGAVYVLTRDGAGQWSQQAYVKASNTGADDWFGGTVVLSGDGHTLAVAAEREDSDATGVGGNQATNGLFDSGAVYVFTRDAADLWSQQAYIKASNPAAMDGFGQELALSDDGSTLAVGTMYENSNATGIDGDQANNSIFGAGAVYVFTRDGADLWSQQAYVKASNTDESDHFGSGVALSADGNTLAVGAFGEDSDAIGIDGDQASDTRFNSGAVYVFVRDAMDQWSQQTYIKASNAEATDNFGYRVTLGSDGSTLAVSALAESSGATGIGGDQTDNSAPGSGAVYVFTRDAAEQWSQQAYVKASNTDGGDLYCASIALSGDGGTLAVNAFYEGSDAKGIGGDQANDSAFNAGAVYLY